MAIQLPRRRDVRPSRKYAQPITRQMIKPVPGRRDPGARGGPSAAATPLAFGGGAGLEEAGKQLTALGDQWAKEEAIAQAQRNALLQEALIIGLTQQLKEMSSTPNTKMAVTGTPNLGGLTSPKTQAAPSGGSNLKPWQTQ